MTKHTVFGNVVEGQDVVDAIAQGDSLDTVEIIRVGEEAQKWNAIEAFVGLKGARLKKQAALKAESEAKMETLQLVLKKTEKRSALPIHSKRFW